MEVRGGFALAVTDPSGVGEVRRRVTALAQALRFGETDVGRAALAATEAATNLAKHARGGVVIFRPCGRGSARGVELLAVDSGPGMRSVNDALRDGYSTAGSPGTGLGALSRLSDEFDIFSAPEQGTVLLSRVWAGDPGEGEAGLSVGVVSVAKPGESVCGDGWAAVHLPGRSLVLCVDGLGHGPDAAAASMAAVRVFEAHAAEGPEALLERMHAALRPTRGAAAAVTDVDLAARVVRYAGVGNIAATVWAPGESRSLVSHNGIVGHEMRKVQRFEVPLPPRGLLVMHSDGIATRWQLEKYPGLALRDPAVVAAVLYRDFCRGRDDATVVVARETAAA